MSAILARIGIILFLVSAYLLAKGIDSMPPTMIKMYGGGIVTGIILFAVGVSSIEKYTENLDEEKETVTYKRVFRDATEAMQGMFYK